MKAIFYEIARWVTVAAAVLILATAAGSSSAVSSADPEEVRKAVCSSSDMTRMQPAPNQTVKRFYGIDPSEYEFCVLYFPLTNMDVEELLLVRYTDSAQEPRIREAARARLDAQKNVFESYGVGQMELLNNHAVYLSDSGFAFFMINRKADKAQAAFLNAVRGK